MKRWSEGAFRSHFSLYPEALKWMVGRVFETTAWANLTYLSKKTFIYRLCIKFFTHCCFYFVYFYSWLFNSLPIACQMRIGHSVLIMWGNKKASKMKQLVAQPDLSISDDGLFKVSVWTLRCTLIRG